MAHPTDSTGGDGRSIDARLAEVVALVQRNALDDAGDRLDQLLREAPGHPATHQLAAQLAVRRGQPDVALRHMEEASRRAPDRADIHFQLACLQAHAGDLEPALAHFHTATRQRPAFAEAWRFLGTTLLRAQRDRIGR